MVQTTKVSMKGSSPATRPSRTGCVVLAAECAMEDEPWPASLEKKARCKPWLKGDTGRAANEGPTCGRFGKCTFENHGKHVGHGSQMSQDDIDRRQEVETAHHGNQTSRHLAHPGNAAQDNCTNQDAKHDAGGDLGHAERRLGDGGRAPGLEDQPAGDGGDQERDAEEAAQPNAGFAKRGISLGEPHGGNPHGTAVGVVGIVGISVGHRLGDFHGLDGHPQKTHDPHPENRAGTAQSNAQCDAADVADTPRLPKAPSSAPGND